MAMINEFMLSKVSTEELIKKNYEKKDSSPNLTAIINRFNDVYFTFLSKISLFSTSYFHSLT
jgi:hypothetical protein